MENRELWLAQTFVELADTLVDDFDIVDFLSRLAGRCQDLFASSEVGFLLADPTLTHPLGWVRRVHPAIELVHGALRALGQPTLHGVRRSGRLSSSTCGWGLGSSASRARSRG